MREEDPEKADTNPESKVEVDIKVDGLMENKVLVGTRTDEPKVNETGGLRDRTPASDRLQG